MDSIAQFRELLSLPNDAHFPEDIMKNVVWCERTFERHNFKTTRLATDRLPLLLAERGVPGAAKTVLIYLQLDGQPVDPSHWNQPSPWDPVLKKPGLAPGEWDIVPWSKLQEDYDPNDRIFARASSDAKGPVAMFLAALSAASDLGVQPNFNMKIIMDFEEELGSPRLAETVVQNRDALAADMLVIFDGPRHISNQPTLTYGARGIATLALEVFGPRAPQHSGHYGNYAPNPALRLAELLASMKDEEGRVLLPGWYDGIALSDEVREILRQVPDDEDEIKRKIGIAKTNAVAQNYQESMQYPS
ncbi:MAG: M20/M25/M40 family metallo-hydrolase, partial [Candidatus Eisenbacteria bacterium]|nr:M20/M25/M40 family metallo-hydrolase [Candidatus Eisenbacteria bacterium]